jgi:hypothetical protein
MPPQGVDQVEYDRELCILIEKAMRLAPTITIFNALLAGQPVPRSALDQAWASRYGI